MQPALAAGAKFGFAGCGSSFDIFFPDCQETSRNSIQRRTMSTLPFLRSRNRRTADRKADYSANWISFGLPTDQGQSDENSVYRQ
jgi:hypothetical protein